MKMQYIRKVIAAPLFCALIIACGSGSGGSAVSGISQPSAPSLHPIGSKSVVEEQLLSFKVTALEPPQRVPVLQADISELPSEAIFVDNGDGTGGFNWTPRVGDAANSPYTIVFTASDAQDSALSDSEAITITVIAASGPGTFQQGSTAQHLVVMEAEHYQNNAPATDGHRWQQVDGGIYSGATAMQVLPGDHTNSGTGYTTITARLSFRVDFVATGTHYVWVRGLEPSTSPESLHVGIDGTGMDSSQNVNGFFPAGSLVWSNVSDDSVRTLQVPSTGVHTINVWMGESGMVFDKLVLITDPNYVPSGCGPGESSLSTYFFDDFRTNTLSAYTVVDTLTSGGFGAFLYDAAANRAELLTGQKVGLKFIESLSGIDTGVFKAEYLPVQGYNNGGTFFLRLKQDSDTYYEISNTETGGAGIVRKVDQGQEVDTIALHSAFSQGVNYHLLVNFRPTDCKVIAFGEILILGADTAPLKLNSLEIELLQEDGFFDNIELTANPFDYYVAAGDSITQGSLDDISSDGTGYEPILENLITDIKGYSHLIVNEGVGGDTSTGGVSLMPTILANNPQARFFLVQYGSNDANMPALSSGLGLQPGNSNYPGTFKDNMQNIITLIIEAGKVPYLAKVPYTTVADRDLNAIQEYNLVIDELVDSNHIGIVSPDFYCYFENHPEFLADGLHPNGLGYQAMAQIWSKVLTDQSSSGCNP
jgi:lysophospholipase L1-like esterase